MFIASHSTQFQKINRETKHGIGYSNMGSRVRCMSLMEEFHRYTHADRNGSFLTQFLYKKVKLKPHVIGVSKIQNLISRYKIMRKSHINDIHISHAPDTVII